MTSELGMLERTTLQLHIIGKQAELFFQRFDAYLTFGAHMEFCGDSSVADAAYDRTQKESNEQSITLCTEIADAYKTLGDSGKEHQWRARTRNYLHLDEGETLYRLDP